jgi:hypothetical protein
MLSNLVHVCELDLNFSKPLVGLIKAPNYSEIQFPWEFANLPMICKDMKTPAEIVLLSTFEHTRKPS